MYASGFFFRYANTTVPLARGRIDGIRLERFAEFKRASFKGIAGNKSFVSSVAARHMMRLRILLGSG
jgi:hypothetical protein